VEPLAAIAILVGALAVSLLALVLLRRRWPDGRVRTVSSLAGTTAAVATPVGVLIAFVAGAALQSHQAALTTVENEAILLVEEHRLAAEIEAPPGVQQRLQGDLVCIARAVIALDWPAMERGQRGGAAQIWSRAAERELAALTPRGANKQAALTQLYDTAESRATAGGERQAYSRGSISLPVWFALGLGSVALVGFILLFSNGSETFLAQAGRLAAVVAGLVAGLIVAIALSVPYGGAPGDIGPDAMRDALATIRADEGPAGSRAPVPCTPEGRTQRP
jgi:hypothetical protein